MFQNATNSEVLLYNTDSLTPAPYLVIIHHSRKQSDD